MRNETAASRDLAYQVRGYSDLKGRREPLIITRGEGVLAATWRRLLARSEFEVTPPIIAAHERPDEPPLVARAAMGTIQSWARSDVTVRSA